MSNYYIINGITGALLYKANVMRVVGNDMIFDDDTRKKVYQVQLERGLIKILDYDEYRSLFKHIIRPLDRKVVEYSEPNSDVKSYFHVKDAKRKKYFEEDDGSIYSGYDDPVPVAMDDAQERGGKKSRRRRRRSRRSRKSRRSRSKRSRK
jgi:hypothetical protein